MEQSLPNIQLQVVTLARYQNQINAVLESNASAVCVEYPYTTQAVLKSTKSGLTTRLYLPNKDKNMKPTQWFNQYYSYDVHSEIIQWLRLGLIDMIKYDDIDMLKELVQEAIWKRFNRVHFLELKVKPLETLNREAPNMLTDKTITTRINTRQKNYWRFVVNIARCRAPK